MPMTFLPAPGGSLGTERGFDPDPAFDPAAGYPDPVFAPGLGGDPFAGPGDAMFTAVPTLMGLIFTVFVVVVVVKLIKAGTAFATNSSLPQQTVTARVVGRRTRTEGGGDTPVRTLHFATFETSTGERVEVKVPQQDYGQLAEGDEGQLTHQGTWYRRFERRRVIPLDGTWEAPGGPSLAPPPAP